MLKPKKTGDLTSNKVETVIVKQVAVENDPTLKEQTNWSDSWLPNKD